MPTLDQAVAAYIKLRDAKAALKKQHTEQLKPYNEKMLKLEGWMLAQLQKEGTQSSKTLSGTVYQSTLTKSVVRDWPAFIDHVRAENLWGLLEQRASKTGVEEYIEAVGNTPPGVEITKETFARIRK